MTQYRVLRSVVMVCAVGLLLAGTGAAQSPVGAPTVGVVQIEWPSATSGALELTVSGPEGFYLRQSFAAGQSAAFSIFDEAGGLRPAGAYAFEVKAIPVLDDQTRDELAAVRDEGGEGALAKSGKVPTLQIASGYFSIIDGAIEMGGKQEAGQAPTGGNRLAEKVVLTNGDGVIRNSLCVGFDCPDSPVFSDSTILLMENNTRIKFGDTSNAPFPNNDWEIEANSSLSGGANYLGFNDCGTADNDGGCATDLVFAVEAGARQNALYVESDGDVGMGTSNPVVNVHVVDGNTPTLRLEQDGSSGFAPQTWDLAGNETNFFIRDVTGGSTLPLRIRPGAPTSSIDIAATGNVGIGTGSPSTRLHVLSSTGSAAIKVEETSGTAADRNLLTLVNNGPPTLFFDNSNAGSNGTWTYTVTNGGIFQVNASGSGAPIEFQLSAGGNLTIGGTLTENSSQTVKTAFEDLDSRQVLDRLVEIPVSLWAYRHDEAGTRHIGPMAEDFFAAFGVGGDDKHIAPSDKAGVALAAIQGLNEVVNEKEAEIVELKARVEKLEKLLAEMAAER